VGGRLGRLTRVRGDGWARSALFDPLGRSYEQHITLTGWRDLTRDKVFRPDGSVESDTLTVRDSTVLRGPRQVRLEPAAMRALRLCQRQPDQLRRSLRERFHRDAIHRGEGGSIPTGS
jgi:hypothetical protein